MTTSAQRAALAAAKVPWLAELPDTARSALLAAAELSELPGGSVLFHEGDPPDAFYIVLSGSLGAYSGRDPVRRHGQITAGETVGELGLITGKPRSATVAALRDSELLRVPAAAFDALVHAHADLMLRMARLAIRRMEQLGRDHASGGPRTLALLPQHANLDLRAHARQIADALSRYGSTTVVDAATGSNRDSAWCHALEAAHRYVIYVADGNDAAWRARMLRQADALLFAARPGEDAAPGSELAANSRDPLGRPEHLLLLHEGKPRLGAARRWYRLRPQARLHHVRDDGDLARVARLVTGHAVGLVLSGGGARGFAHIGVIKALREAGITIDRVGGTSIGAIIGAGLAADWSTEEMVEVFRRTFVDTNPLSDWTVPFVALVAGRKVSRLLRQTFGERDIVDLVLPYFCCSADLTAGRLAVHREGPLWQWLRASVAIPGVLPPVFHGGHIYVDGGVINNLPVDVMRGEPHASLIAVDIGGDYALSAPGIEEFDLPGVLTMVRQWFAGLRRPSLKALLLRAGMLNAAAVNEAGRRVSTLLIAPPTNGIELLDWRAYHRAIDIGYQHALRVVGADPDLLAGEAPLLDV